MDFLELSAVVLLITLAIKALRDLKLNFEKPYPTCENRIFIGNVMHSRKQPKKHSFGYKIFMMYVELNENVDNAFDQFYLWSSNPTDSGSFLSRFKHWATFDQRKYLSREQVVDLVRAETSIEVTGKVFLLTNFKYFGYQFNPVSYYYCFDDQKELVAMISEIHNTPWKEMIRYVHPVKNSSSSVHRHFQQKQMHVSPFFGMDYEYQISFNVPKDEELMVSWKMSKNNQADFYAVMKLKGVPINQNNLNFVLFRYPWMTAKVIAAIHFQALQLYFKVPFFDHPKYKKDL
eukprot:TRINITY_DN3891_c0_g1_i1.p1 TRINITY_DN3891_c0_g1~~TRINITY_DN3891_c0_g1_i1.p1  ORF type:complete len:326 (-),score=57.80 TRINITY_DN3891_c0_g1_i1:4-870(-)